MKPSGISIAVLVVAWGTIGLATGGGIARGATVEKELVGRTPGGERVDQYTLTNDQGLEVKVINRGAMITSVRVPDRNGKFESVALYFDPPQEYLKRRTVQGAIVGRYANRIAGARFTLDGVEHHISPNAGKNHIHGGRNGFHTIVWDAQPIDDADGVGVKLTHTSPDGHEGYPGTVAVEVVYKLTAANELKMEYTAQTDKPTHLNLTNHAYWNLAGADSPDMVGQVLFLNADCYLPFGEKKIPTGELRGVKGTCMDFTEPKTIGSRIDQVQGGDYDHCYVLNKKPGERLSLCAKVVDPKSGRVMEVLTTQPGVQLYTGNRRGFCLETQHFPNSPNEPDFPSTVLRPGETYHEVTIHKFSTQ